MSDIYNLQFEDSLATTRLVAKNGYYQVGEKNYVYKINALEEATRTKQSIQWEFNNQVYKNHDWKKSLGIGLDTLYRIRAQQLRDRYNYLVLAFSGGGDSYNVLRSFLDNNIHLDEIICDWPLAQTERQLITAKTDPTNYISEWDLAIKPVLKQLSQTHPNIKITVSDSLQRLSMEDHEDTCTVTQIHNYVSIKRYRHITSHMRTLQEQHGQAAIILGIEKPGIYIKNNVACAYFNDAHCWYKSSITDTQLDVEYFYWSHDLPEIVSEQAHALYNYLKQNKSVLDLFRVSETFTDPVQNRVVTQNIRNICRSLLYPKWNSNIFQADKGNSLIYNEQYNWFFSQEKTREIQSWESSMHSRLNLIDSKYLDNFADGRFKGYKPIYSNNENK
jgi:hypothetical protein